MGERRPFAHGVVGAGFGCAAAEVGHGWGDFGKGLCAVFAIDGAAAGAGGVEAQCGAVVCVAVEVRYIADIEAGRVRVGCDKEACVAVVGKGTADIGAGCEGVGFGEEVRVVAA